MNCLVTSVLPSGQGASLVIQSMLSFILHGMDANPCVGCSFRQPGSKWGEKSVPCAVPYHAPSCSADGTVMFCLTWLTPAPPPSLQQSQVRREPFLERSPTPRAAEVSGPLSSSQHGAEQTFAGKLRWLHSPCLAVPTQCLAWPQSTPALKAAGDCQSSLSGRCSPGNGWVHFWDGSRGFTAGQA